MIINNIRPIMKAATPSVPDTWDNLYAFFLNRVRNNLHVMLCFSPVGNKFSTRAQQFPGLINGCTIDWFLPWPEEALTSGACVICSCWGWRATCQRQPPEPPALTPPPANTHTLRCRSLQCLASSSTSSAWPAARRRARRSRS